MKNPVKQKDELGCVAACIAFLTDNTYENVANNLGKEKAKTKGFYCREIVEYLNNLGYQAEFHYLKPKWRKKIYKEGTIVFIKRSRKYPYGHYLIRYRNFWMDPWINFQEEKKLIKAKAGFRKKLPGKPIYGIFVK